MVVDVGDVDGVVVGGVVSNSVVLTWLLSLLLCV